MKVEFDRLVMRKALSRLVVVVPRSTVLESLGCVLLDCKDDIVTLSATDTVVGVQTTVSASVEESGEALIPLRTLHDLLDASGEKRATLTQDVADGFGAVLKLGRSTSTIKGENPGDAVRLKFSGEVQGRMDAGVLRRALGWASSCASRTGERLILDCVYIKTDDGATSFVGTDGFKIAVANIPGGNLSDGTEYLIPNRALVKVWRVYREAYLRVAKGQESPQVLIRAGKGSLIFEFPDFKITHRLNQGHFIDYERAVPKRWNMRLVLKLDQFLYALRVIRVIAKRRRDFSKTVFQVFPNEQVLRLFTYVEQEAVITHLIPLVDLDMASGADAEYLAFILNSYWTFKALRQFEGVVEKIAVEIVAKDRPFIFRPMGDTIWSGSYSFQMPMSDDAVLAHAESERAADELLISQDDEDEYRVS